MRTLILSVLMLLGSSGCTTPAPSGRTLVSVSWNNPGPHTLRHASLSLGGKQGVVYVEEVPAYTELPVETTLPLSVRPVATVSYRSVSGNHRQRFSLDKPLRSDAADEYNLRIHVVGWDVIGVELEPVSVARERLRHAAGTLSP